MLAPGDELPAGYERLTIEVFRDRVNGPQAYKRLAVVAEARDRPTMCAHAFLQLGLRSRAGNTRKQRDLQAGCHSEPYRAQILKAASGRSGETAVVCEDPASSPRLRKRMPDLLVDSEARCARAWQSCGRSSTSTPARTQHWPAPQRLRDSLTANQG